MTRKKNRLARFSIAELEKQIKILRVTTGILAGILIVLFGYALYDSVSEEKFNPFLISAIALSAIIPLNIKRGRDIKREIKDRRSAPGTD